MKRRCLGTKVSAGCARMTDLQETETITTEFSTRWITTLSGQQHMQILVASSMLVSKRELLFRSSWHITSAYSPRKKAPTTAIDFIPAENRKWHGFAQILWTSYQPPNRISKSRLSSKDQQQLLGIANFKKLQHRGLSEKVVAHSDVA